MRVGEGIIEDPEKPAAAEGMNGAGAGDHLDMLVGDDDDDDDGINEDPEGMNGGGAETGIGKGGFGDCSAPSSSEPKAYQHGCCYRGCTRIGCGCIARLPEKWPRTFGVVFGVVLPLFLLIGVSLFFGYFLAYFEAPGEIDANNEVIATRFGFQLREDLYGNITVNLPHMCLVIYANEILTEFDERVVDWRWRKKGTKDLETEPESLYDSIAYAIDIIFTKQYNSSMEIDREVRNGTLAEVDLAEALDFMTECGEIAWDVAHNYTLIKGGIVDIDLLGDDVTFNWLRCDKASRNKTTLDGFWDDIWNPFKLGFVKPGSQERLVMEEWKIDQRKLYDEYFADFKKKNFTTLQARQKALTESYDQADGFENCYVDTSAAAWFWFTVMTTIGYGNQAPVTVGGRTMIYTLGFFSILLFAAILSRAGTIVTTIFDDWAQRMRLSWLNTNWVACMFWGSLYYGWMVVIALYTRYWKEQRLNEDMEFVDAYWFSYISTTTVGLGDYYLEPEVILRQDLLSFPLLFLFGFVLLANFLVKLSELVLGWFPQNRPTLEENLKKQDPPCFPKLPMSVRRPRAIRHYHRHHHHKREYQSELDLEDEAPGGFKQEEAPKEMGHNASTVNPTSVDVDGWSGVVTGVAASDLASHDADPQSVLLEGSSSRKVADEASP